MSTRLALLFLALATALPAWASSAPETVAGTVTFTTSRSVYLSLEQPAAVAPGDSVPAGTDVSTFESAAVRAVSPTSLVLERGGKLATASAGDRIFVQVPLRRKTTASPAVQSVQSAGSAAAGKTNGAFPLEGRASLQYYRFRGPGGGREYDQPSLFLDARYRGVFGLPVDLNLRARTRLQRELHLPDGHDTHTGRADRLYDLSLDYAVPGSPWRASLGRLRTLRATSMGGLDGLVVERFLGRGTSAGFFGGVTPELEDFLGDRSGLKRGGWLHWERERTESTGADATISYIAESGSGRFTAHLLSLEHSFSQGRWLYLSQEAALNLRPRGTGREGETVQNIRSYLSIAPHDMVRFSGSYSAYLVPEYRDLDRFADPLEALRYERTHTFLPSVEFTFFRRLRISGEVLLEPGGSNRQKLLSRAARVYYSGIPVLGVSAGVSRIETFQEGGEGDHTLLHLSRTIIGGVSANLTGALTQYHPSAGKSYRTSQMRAGAYWSLGRSHYGSANFTRTWGDSAPSGQFFLEWGTRFGR